MAKQNVNNYNIGPWEMKRTLIVDFRLITPDNRKNAIVTGRILYIIEPNGLNFTFRGTMSIDPCFVQGWFKYPLKPWQSGYPSHTRVYMNANMDYNVWASENKILIDRYINEKVLYLKPTDPILTYYKE